MSRRGTTLPITNRFEAISVEACDDGWGEPLLSAPSATTFYDDQTRTILAKNNSPDIPFTYSLNPYRGCEHGCVYCYARPSHEYLGFNAAEDFESKILVKRNAAALLEETFRKPSWKPNVISMSGNTDCYQPAESTLRITRSCLEVFQKYRNPVGIITKNFLVTRDIDILENLAAHNLAGVMISITTLDLELTRSLEPRTSMPERRLRAIELLSAAGINVGVMVAPIIPGLNDHEIPAIIEAAAARGAKHAGTQIVRLPLSVEPILVDWLERERPLQKNKVLAHLRDVRGGKLSESNFGERMRGSGPQAELIHSMFRIATKRAGLNKSSWHLSTEHFRRNNPQMELFAAS